jgi:hypothetical protein
MVLLTPFRLIKFSQRLMPQDFRAVMAEWWEL